MLHKITLLIIIISITAIASIASFGQKTGVHKSKFLGGMSIEEAIALAREGKARMPGNIVSTVKDAYKESKNELLVSEPDLTGTWNVTVPGETPEQTFYSLQTFDFGGTFSEVSTLLPGLFESPAHGVWGGCRRRTCTLTFETFEFDPTGQYFGRLRLRNAIQLPTSDHFVSSYTVDFIELDGTVESDIFAGTFSGDRMQLRGM